MLLHTELTQLPTSKIESNAFLKCLSFNIISGEDGNTFRLKDDHSLNSYRDFYFTIHSDSTLYPTYKFEESMSATIGIIMKTLTKNTL